MPPSPWAQLSLFGLCLATLTLQGPLLEISGKMGGRREVEAGGAVGAEGGGAGGGFHLSMAAAAAAGGGGEEQGQEVHSNKSSAFFLGTMALTHR